MFADSTVNIQLPSSIFADSEVNMLNQIQKAATISVAFGINAMAGVWFLLLAAFTLMLQTANPLRCVLPPEIGATQQGYTMVECSRLSKKYTDPELAHDSAVPPVALYMPLLLAVQAGGLLLPFLLWNSHQYSKLMNDCCKMARNTTKKVRKSTEQIADRLLEQTEVVETVSIFYIGWKVFTALWFTFFATIIPTFYKDEESILDLLDTNRPPSSLFPIHLYCVGGIPPSTLECANNIGFALHMVLFVTWLSLIICAVPAWIECMAIVAISFLWRRKFLEVKMGPEASELGAWSVHLFNLFDMCRNEHYAKTIVTKFINKKKQ